MRRYELTTVASQDVLGIWKYIARDNGEAADRLLDRFSSVYETLTLNPLMGESVRQYRDGLRRFVVGKYAIYYEVQEECILVIRVLHGARDHDQLL